MVSEFAVNPFAAVLLVFKVSLFLLQCWLKQKLVSNQPFFFSSTGDVFSQSDTAKTMAEITRIDPQFNKDRFLKECEFEIIPSVLEVRKQC